MFAEYMSIFCEFKIVSLKCKAKLLIKYSKFWKPNYQFKLDAHEIYTCLSYSV